MLNKFNNDHYNALSGTTMTNQSINERLSQHHSSNNIVKTTKQRQQTIKLNNTKMSTTMEDNSNNRRRQPNNIYNFIRSQATMYSSTPPIKLMLTIQIALLIMLSTIINLTQAQNSDVTNVLKKLKIVPDLIANPPPHLVTLKINDKTIKPGEVLNVKDLKMLPTFSWSDPNGDARSTIVLLDVDRKKTSPNTTINSYNHLTTINIPGDNVQSGTAIVAYDPPGHIPVPTCQPGTKHRYLVLVYHQNEVVDLPKVTEFYCPSGYSPKREDFKLNYFATNLGLTLKAANVFIMQSESGGLCSGTSSYFQISQWSTYISMIVSSLFMVLMSYCIKDSLQ